MPTIVKAKSLLLQLLSVSTAVMCLAVVGCARHQTPATISDGQPLDTQAALHTQAPPRPLGPVQPRKAERVDLSRAMRLAAVDQSSSVIPRGIETPVSYRNPPTPENTKPVIMRRAGFTRFAGNTLTTLHLNDVDVRQALEMLGRTHGVNILIAPGVEGRVTADLAKLDFDAAFNALLKLSDLVAVDEEGLIYVYAKRYYRDDIHVHSFPLDYVSVLQVLPVIQTLLSVNGQAVPMEADPIDNRKTRESIVVTDTPTVIGRVIEYLDQVDVPPRQVMIEVHILEVTLTDDLQHGIDYKHLMNFIGGSSV